MEIVRELSRGVQRNFESTISDRRNIRFCMVDPVVHILYIHGSYVVRAIRNGMVDPALHMLYTHGSYVVRAIRTARMKEMSTGLGARQASFRSA